VSSFIPTPQNSFPLGDSHYYSRINYGDTTPCMHAYIHTYIHTYMAKPTSRFCNFQLRECLRKENVNHDSETPSRDEGYERHKPSSSCNTPRSSMLLMRIHHQTCWTASEYVHIIYELLWLFNAGRTDRIWIASNTGTRVASEKRNYLGDFLYATVRNFVLYGW
jgi:hypothetical protein